MKPLVYLDNAATTHPKPDRVYQTAERVLRSGGSAGRGMNRSSKAAAAEIYESRCSIAGFLGVADEARLTFQPGATQALNTAIFGLTKPGDKIATTMVEHNAVARPLQTLAGRGHVIKKCGCSRSGQLNLTEFEALCKESDIAVLTHASNVSGILFPLKKIAGVAKKCGVKLIVDASQTAGHEAIDVDGLGITALICSGHKGLFGVAGAAVLAAGAAAEIEPLVYGGTGSLSESERMPEFLPDRLESGTQNTTAIAAMREGVDFISVTGMKKIRGHELQLADWLRNELLLTEGVTLHGAALSDERTAIVSISVDSLDSAELEWRLDEEYSIVVRGGLHCSPWSHHTLGTIDTGTVRFSPGWFNTQTDVERAVAALKKLASARKRR